MSLDTPRIVDGNPMLIVGLEEHCGANAQVQIPALWQRFAPSIGKIPGQVGYVAYGVCHDMTKEGFSYLAGVEIPADSPIPEGFASLSLPAQRYAVFTHDGHVSKLKDLGDAIWSQWLPGTGEQVTDNPVMFERYGEAFDPHTGIGDMEMWLSIK